MYQIVISAFLFRLINCYNFNVINVSKIELNSNENYFGYSLLLQKGNPSLLIVGAPKAVNFNKQTGTIYGCILDDNIKCSQYKTNNYAGTYYNGTGDFLGAALDGDNYAGGQLFTCAPRLITDEINSYFLNGQCFYIKNTTNFQTFAKKFSPYTKIRQISAYGSNVYFDEAFGEAGFDIAFNKQKNELLVGLPGLTSWFGGFFKFNTLTSSASILPGNVIEISNHSPYFGYSIAYGYFLSNSEEIWYIAGAPRQSALRGEVILVKQDFWFFSRLGMTIKRRLIGDEMGSYFGSVILVVKVDGIDSLLVGAPMFSGKTWDEGCVYFYKNKGNGEFETPVELLGMQKVAGRFGTQISNLGDIDLDSFNDVAISAPFENNGIGAVYIYLGNKNGFDNTFSQRITPEDFSINLGKPVKRFGNGLSNGNDINGDGHNDLAIGAYKSDQVFILKTLPIIDFVMELRSNQSTLYLTTKQFTIFYCVKYNPRNNRIKNLDIITELLLDNRASNNRNITKEARLLANTSSCQSQLVQLQDQMGYNEPFAIQLRSLTKQNNFVTTDNVIKTDIPFDYGCGTDNVCQVDLSLETNIGNLFFVTPGIHKEIEVNITIKNSGEAAYHTELFIQIPENVEIINLRECKINHGRNYSCIISEGPLVQKIKTLHLDVRQIELELKELTIDLSVTSLGHDIKPNDNKFSLKIPIVVRNSPYIESKSAMDNLVYTDLMGNLKDKIEFSQEFLIGNMGPSPAILDIKILTPSFNKAKNKQIFQIETEEDNLSNSITYCNYVNSSTEIEWNHLDVVINAPMNRTVVINCTENQENCVTINCPGIYLRKSSETVKVILKIIANVDSMVKNYREELRRKNIIAFVSSAILSNGTDIIENAIVTLLHGPLPKKPVPFWVYIVSGTIGVILLLLIIFGLYKCNFFNRQYKNRRLREEYLNSTEDLNSIKLEADHDEEL